MDYTRAIGSAISDGVVRNYIQELGSTPSPNFMTNCSILSRLISKNGFTGQFNSVTLRNFVNEFTR